MTDYPNCLDGRPAQTTIKAMMPSRMLRVSAKQLQHCMRPSKASKGLVSKFIVHPNYKMKISRELVAHVNFITATRVKDGSADLPGW